MVILYFIGVALGILGCTGMDNALTKKSIGTTVFSVVAILLACGCFALHMVLYGW